MRLNPERHVALRYDPTLDWGRGSWTATSSNVSEAAYFHLGPAIERKKPYEALVGATPNLPGWELTEEQQRTIGDLCTIIAGHHSWQVEVESSDGYYLAKVVDQDLKQIIGSCAPQKDPAEAFIRAMDDAVSKGATWV